MKAIYTNGTIDTDDTITMQDFIENIDPLEYDFDILADTVRVYRLEDQADTPEVIAYF